MQYDAIIIGAGPAGAAAAMTCAELGLSVLMLDEQESAGGQVWRAPCVVATEAA
jgi:flavin-dependent dehydrogenase